VPSTQKGIAEQPAKIADLFSKCSQLADQQEKEMGRIVGTMLPVLAYLNEPITLRPGSLGGSFAELRSVSLQAGAVVVTTDFQGRVASRQLAKLETADCLAVLKDAFPELQRLVADKKRAASVRPIFSMKLVLGGQRFIVDTRSYRLLVSNSGGDCRGLRISAELADGRNKDYRERDLSRGGRIDVDLGVFKELEGAESLRLRFECEDVDGREFCGAESLRLDGERLQEAALSRKSPLARSLPLRFATTA
jgi:hypothetical protein